ncbi:MAG: polymorphic toxin-type HINT domain-containing protein [Oligoflexales bacterium]
MKKFNRILISLSLILASSKASATDLGGTMNHLSSKSNRDKAAGMSHSHNADGSKRSKAEGSAISRVNRSGSRSHSSGGVNASNNSIHYIQNHQNIHQRPKLSERGSYAETCFTGDTLVTVSKEKSTELIPIKDVQVGDSVVSCSIEDGSKLCHPREVLAKSEVPIEDHLLAIGLKKGEIKTTFEHKFYVVNEGWVPAEDLQIGDQLLSEGGEVVNIKSIEQLEDFEGSTTVYDLKVDAEEDHDHNYFVGTDRVLVHNCDIAIAGVAANPAAVAPGVIARGWMTKLAAGAQYTATVGSVGLTMMNKTDDNDDTSRVFEENPKHRKNVSQGKGGCANPEPTNPQKALDNSVEMEGNSSRRVSVDKENGEFSVFDEHTSGKFHGHTRSWDQLNQRMKNALIKSGKVTPRGKIK